MPCYKIKKCYFAKLYIKYCSMTHWTVSPIDRVKWRHGIYGHDRISILWAYHGIMCGVKGRRFIVLFKQHSIRWFMKMSVWSLACRQSVFQWHHSEKHLSEFTHKMAAKASWHWNYVTVTLCIYNCYVADRMYCVSFSMIYKIVCILIIIRNWFVTATAINFG